VADFEDYYEILQVSPSAEPEVIEGAYKKLANKYHPDVDKSPSATERMKKINVAHDILSNPDKRREYDKEWQKHKGDDARPRGASQSKTGKNNIYRKANEDNGKPQTRVYERIVIIILLVALIALLIQFLLVPKIQQAIAQYPWLKAIFWLLVALFVFSLVKFQSFRQGLSKLIQTIFVAIRSWVTSGDLKEEVEEPNIDKWTWEPENMEGKLACDVWDLILNFRPKRSYDYEDGYHKELYAHLKKRFPQAEMKPTRGASQIDIGIDNIGIEVKGPTRKGDLKDINDKVVRYTQYWSPMFVVLFNPKFGEGLTEKYFREIKDGIQRRHNDEIGVITKRR